MKFTTIRLFFLCMSLSMSLIGVGCSQRKSFQNETVSNQEFFKKELPVEVYVLEETHFGKYEPEEGIYTGAYVEKDQAVGGDLLKYETLVGQKQTFKVLMYNKEQGISKQDILRCIAQKKVPYIKLMLNEQYDLTSLYQLIFDLKLSYQTPVFVELYPLTEKNYDVSLYRETYQRAYEILHKYLPDVTVVWSSDDTRISDMALFYPGKGYVDWVGLNVYIPNYKKGELYRYNGLNALDYWYKSFQEDKPMMISALAVSHYSNVDHAYTLAQAENQLALFYKEVLPLYPRLKGMIYMDVDMKLVSPKGKEDYSIAGEEYLCETIKTLSVPLKINECLENNVRKSVCYMKYSIKGILVGEALYIPQEYMASCFKEVPLRKLKRIQDLSGEVYYAYKDIRAYCTTYYKA